ncbi:hypothetical protein N410_03650 [Helicobacter pylori GC26]|uniref:hypothetical protein n=1 Tax=Helicobacter pylori TaxID=210 RepID=UPI00038E25F7|nr:hypothetical protein [Helicobacter pylori]EQL76642.1 hypothetical protein N410_03650 [Helicobacter pylori GC26]
MQKKKAKNPQPNLFSILDNGDIATNNPSEETNKVNDWFCYIQEVVCNFFCEINLSSFKLI